MKARNLSPESKCEELTAVLSNHVLNDRDAVLRYLLRFFVLDSWFIPEFWELIEAYSEKEWRLALMGEVIKTNKELQGQLFKLVEDSKQVHEQEQNDEKRVQAAANAITLLNLARINFSERDLSNIRIPGANLSGALLDHTQLQGSDLRKVNLQGAWLRGTNLRQAKMADIQFGGKPKLFAFLPGSIAACTYSAGKQWLVVGCRNKTIYLYDAHRECVMHTFEGDAKITSVTFGAGSALLAAGSEDGTVCVWDVESKSLVYIFKKHKVSVRSVAFDGEGALLASGSADGEVCIWDMKSKSLVQTLKGHTKQVASVVFDAGLLASGSEDGRICVWDVKSQSLVHTFKEQMGPIISVAFDGEGALLASGSADGKVCVWDMKSKRNTFDFFQHKSIYSVAFGAKGALLAWGSVDGEVCVWDMRNNKQLKRTYRHEGGARIISLAFDTKDVLVSASQDGTVCRRDMRNGSLAGNTFKWQKDFAVHNVFGARNMLVSVSHDGAVCASDIESGKLVHTFSIGETVDITSMALGAGSLLALESKERKVYVWDMSIGELVHTLSMAKKGDITNVALGAEGLLAMGDEYGEVWVWNMRNVEQPVLLLYKKEVCALVFSAGNLLALGDHNGMVCVWDMNNRKLMHNFMGSKEEKTELRLTRMKKGNNVAFGADGLLASGSESGAVRVWNMNSKKLVCMFKESNRVVSLAFAGNLLATGSDSNVVRIWDIRSETCLTVLKGFIDYVQSIAWLRTADGLFLATGDRDNVVCHWQVRERIDELNAVLCRSSHQAVLCAHQADLTRVLGLTQEDYSLLRQQGAQAEVKEFDPFEKSLVEYIDLYIRNRLECGEGKSLEKKLISRMSKDLAGQLPISRKRSRLFAPKGCDLIFKYVGDMFEQEDQYQDVMKNIIISFVHQISKNDFWIKIDAEMKYTNTLKLFCRAGLQRLCKILTGSEDPKEKHEIKKSFELFLKEPQEREKALKKVCEQVGLDWDDALWQEAPQVERVVFPRSHRL